MKSLFLLAFFESFEIYMEISLIGFVNRTCFISLQKVPISLSQNLFFKLPPTPFLNFPHFLNLVFLELPLTSRLLLSKNFFQFFPSVLLGPHILDFNLVLLFPPQPSLLFELRLLFGAGILLYPSILPVY